MKLVLIASVALALACSESDDNAAKPPASESQTDRPPSSPTPEPDPKPTPQMIWHPIAELGIQIEVPGPASHSLVLTDVYGVNAPGCALEIGRDHRGDSVYDDILASLAKNAAGNTVESFSKKQKNDDGTFAIEASYKTKGGTRWIVEDHIAVDGAKVSPLSCRQRGIKSAEHAACVARACASAKRI